MARNNASKSIQLRNFGTLVHPLISITIADSNCSSTTHNGNNVDTGNGVDDDVDC